jgi:hypothetical protein
VVKGLDLDFEESDYYAGVLLINSSHHALTEQSQTKASETAAGTSIRETF